MPRSGITFALAAAAIAGLAPAGAVELQTTARYTYIGIGPDVQEQVSGIDLVSMQRAFEQSTTGSDGTNYLNSVVLDFRGQAAHGQLKAFAQAQLGSTEDHPGDGTSNGGILIGGAQAQAFDTLRIEGLAPGSLVEFTVWAQLQASVASSTPNRCGEEFFAPATAFLNLQVDGAYSADGGGLGTSVGDCEPGAMRVSRRFEAHAGESFSLRSTLDANLYLATNSDDPAQQQAFGVVDAAHTAWVWFTLHDPSAQLVADSGSLYAAPPPVPEPATWLLMALGGAALTARACRGAAHSPAH